MSALLFAGAHLSLSGFLSLALVGVVLAWLYERTGSLVAPVAAHGVFNAFSIALIMLIYRIAMPFRVPNARAAREPKP